MRLMLCVPSRLCKAQVVPWEKGFLEMCLKLLEKTLDNREYLCSNRFTLADICVSYAINLAEALGIEQAFKPNIMRWTDNLFSRPAFIKSKGFKYEPET